MRKIDRLRELQELDTALDGVRQELEQCRVRLGDDSDLVPLKEQQETARRQLHDLQRSARDLDYELESKSSRRKAEEKKLYDGSIKNPKELTSLAQEVDHQKELIGRLEDQILANMDALDNASREVDVAQRTFVEREGLWKEEEAALDARCSALAAQEADLDARRREAAGRVDQVTLRSYESIRRNRGGLAVAAIEQRACQGCRISLSSSVVQRARAGAELVTCTNCGRFLYHQ